MAIQDVISKRLQQITQPVQKGVEGFMNPPSPSGDVVQRTLDTIPVVKNVRGFSEGMFGQQAVNHPQLSWALDTITPKGNFKYVRMHPEDIQAISPALERYMSNDTPSYWIGGQRAMDEQFIKDLAGHYIGKDILKTYKNSPQNIAQELMNRVFQDRKYIPQRP